MGRCNPRGQALQRAAACLTFVLVLFLYYLASSHSTTSSSVVTLPQRPTAHEHSAQLQGMPLLGMLLSNTSSPIKLNCSYDPSARKLYLLRRSLAARSPPRVEWREAVGLSATLHKCSVEVEVSPCKCRRTVTALLPHPCPIAAAAPQSLLQHIKATLGESTCGDLATLRGTAQKVVTYSLGGKAQEDYRQGLTLLVPQVEEMYPGWTMRVYVNSTLSAPFPWACPLACQHHHLDFCDVARLPGLGDVSWTHPRVWRFAVFGDRLVRRFMLRDADSPVLQREVAAVAQWLRGGKCYHVMRDNPFHGVPILTGMFGGCTSWRHSVLVAARDAAFCVPLGPGGDQDLLGELVWPTVQHNVTMHDSFKCRTYSSALPFPTQRVNFTYVGMSTYRWMYSRDRVRVECPRACRPKEHLDWTYC